MFGPVGGPELILILVLALLLFGPRKLPQIGRTIGKALAEFRSVTNEFKSTLDREVALKDLQETHQELKTTAREVTGAVRGVARETPTERPAVAPKTTDPETGMPDSPPKNVEREAPKPVTPDGGSTDTA